MFHRAAFWAGLAQDVPLQSNSKYYFNAMLKYTNEALDVYEEANVRMRIDYEDGKYIMVFSHLALMLVNCTGFI